LSAAEDPKKKSSSTDNSDELGGRSRHTRRRAPARTKSCDADLLGGASTHSRSSRRGVARTASRAEDDLALSTKSRTASAPAKKEDGEKRVDAVVDAAEDDPEELDDILTSGLEMLETYKQQRGGK